MIVLYLIDLYLKLVVLTVGLSKSLMSALLVGKGFCPWPSISCMMWDSRLRVLLASMMLSENIVDGIGSLLSSLKIGLESARRLTNKIRQIAK